LSRSSTHDRGDTAAMKHRGMSTGTAAGCPPPACEGDALAQRGSGGGRASELPELILGCCEERGRRGWADGDDWRCCNAALEFGGPALEHREKHAVAKSESARSREPAGPLTLARRENLAVWDEEATIGRGPAWGHPAGREELRWISAASLLRRTNCTAPLLEGRDEWELRELSLDSAPLPVPKLDRSSTGSTRQSSGDAAARGIREPARCAGAKSTLAIVSPQQGSKSESMPADARAAEALFDSRRSSSRVSSKSWCTRSISRSSISCRVMRRSISPSARRAHAIATPTAFTRSSVMPV